MLRSLFIDFNAYFASVEQQHRPHLRGRPVGVVPLMADTTCCIAASYEAKAHGVRTGTSVADARRLCPDITLVEARQALYVDVHHQAIAAVDRVAPVRQVLSIDEMECELTGAWCQPQRALALARQVKQVIHEQLGECLRCSIGIAPNTLLGKLASDMHKPDGLTLLQAQDLPEQLYGLALGDFTGIGPRMRARLQRCGITTVQALYAAPRPLLRQAWGSVAGDEMYDKLRGQWYAPRSSPARSIGHSHVMPPTMRQPDHALAVLNRLVQKAAMRLRKQGLYATALLVFVHAGPRRAQGASAQRDTRFGETQDTALLLHALHTLWHSGLQHLARPQVVGVTLHGLVPARLHTPSLFDPTPDDLRAARHGLYAPVPGIDGATPHRPVAPQRDRSRLYAAMDEVNRVHGKNALYFGSAHTARDHAPMRIAFNRIPDLETER